MTKACTWNKDTAAHMDENAKDVLPNEPQFIVCEQGISYNSVIMQDSVQPLNLQFDLISRNEVPHIHSSPGVVLLHIFCHF